MRFEETRLSGAFIVDLERRVDSRGFFARVFCRREFEEHGLNPAVVQANVGRSTRKGTVRGMHFQFPPHAEAKLIRATQGTILDVGVDLRPESPTFLQHVTVELTAEDGRALYLPERFAHGYQTLVDGAEMLYFTSAPYAPTGEGGLSPLDPRLGIGWALPVTEISAKDLEARRLDDQELELAVRMRV